MPKIIQGKLDGKGFKFAIVVSRFNDFVTNRLQEGAIDALLRCNVKDEDITIIKVPGSFEIPYAAQKICDTKKFDAIICLGAIIQGETSHHQYIASEVTKGIAQSSMKSGIPIIFGVLTTENLEQAIERAGAKSGNKGWEAAISAIEMVSLFKAL